MPVVLLKMVPARSAGTLFSVDANTGRPVFRIEANFGLGESVVSGTSHPDQWWVAPDATMILEKDISKKAKPSLADEEVLKLARIALKIQRRYAEKGVLNIDAEFAVDESGIIYIVQTRPETATKGGKFNIQFTTVNDEEEAARGTTKIPLTGQGSIIAVNGVATGRLVIATIPAGLPDKELQNKINEIVQLIEAGDILVAVDTDNKWNNAFMRISGVITDRGGWTSHAAVTSRERKMPCLVGTKDATNTLKSLPGRKRLSDVLTAYGVVTFDAYKKSIYLTSDPLTKVVEIDTAMWRPVPDLLADTPALSRSVWRTSKEFVEGYSKVDNFYAGF
jgi:Phosphoenolpyruvate synthase/pyruvate phosphate dikinase